MARDIWVQSQVESYQRLKKWCLMLSFLTLNIVRYVSRVKWSNPGKGVTPCPTPWCRSYRKGSFRVTLDYGRQLYFTYPAVHGKDHVLGNVFGGTFSNSFRQNLSPHLHWQDTLLSTFCQIWDFLPSCWSCQLTLWLEICVPIDKFGFSGNNC